MSQVFEAAKQAPPHSNKASTNVKATELSEWSFPPQPSQATMAQIVL